MRIHNRNSLGLAAACALGALLAGCAAGPPPRKTVADLARAQTTVAEAQRSGSQQYAPTTLQKARDEVQQAEHLSDHGHPLRADQLANEAAVDAQFAMARASDSKAQRDLKDQKRTLQTLRNEEGRQ